MKKIIRVGNRELAFDANALCLIFYRNAFKKDLIRDITRNLKKDDTIQYKIAYVMSDAVKKGISFDDWLSGFSIVELLELLPQTTELMTSQFETVSEDAPTAVTEDPGER